MYSLFGSYIYFIYFCIKKSTMQEINKAIKQQTNKH